MAYVTRGESEALFSSQALLLWRSDWVRCAGQLSVTTADGRTAGRFGWDWAAEPSQKISSRSVGRGKMSHISILRGNSLSFKRTRRMSKCQPSSLRNRARHATLTNYDARPAGRSRGQSSSRFARTNAKVSIVQSSLTLHAANWSRRRQGVQHHCQEGREGRQKWHAGSAGGRRRDFVY